MTKNSHDTNGEAFRAAHETILKLINNFHVGEELFLSRDYSEQQARIDFIDKFWAALGWDVAHHLQLNPYEQEVKVERNVNDEGRGRRADYAFLQPNFRDVRFFVEAKRPGSDIDTPDNFFQVARYGWNSQIPLSILTSFAHFRVIDCRAKPDITTVMKRGIPDLAFAYSDFVDAEKFAAVYFLFSRESSHKGAIERFAATLGAKTTKSPRFQQVGDDFLEKLDHYRELLAKSFKRLNPELDSEQLTEATQRTLDRFVFTRFLEDKLIEPDTIVERLGQRAPIWRDFVSASRRLNSIYNGVIFRRNAIIDADTFNVDEKVIALIRDELSGRDSPYAFHYIPIHTLGSLYESFLSKTIVATAKHARVELKPEKRKRKGVFYTPEFVVRYMVSRTVDKKIAALSPSQMTGFKFADISCGSGSFLLGVYDSLIRRHAAFFNERGNRRFAKAAGCVESAVDGSFHLSLRQKREILVNNLFGVDIDPQAVEVAQLSLYLKLLEEETTASAKHYQLQFEEKLLPDLSKNIVCGNGLIVGHP